MSYSIVILSKSRSNLAACLEALTKCEPLARVITVDDFEEPLTPYDSLSYPAGGIINWQLVKGEKPFIFARNANIGIRAAGADDVILLNDDAILQTPGGFDLMEKAAHSAEGVRYGVISAFILGGAAAPDQIADRLKLAEFTPAALWRCKHHMLAFICVYIRREVLEAVGELDERYIGYGYDDDDYCLRIRRLGLQLGVCGCLVEHGSLPSTFRGRGVATVTLEQNYRIFCDKWGGSPAEMAELAAGLL
jgi:GT2 family glycosyltransferase